MRHPRSHRICKEEFAFAVVDATNKLNMSIDNLFVLCGLKGGRQTYYRILENGTLDKGTTRKLKKYIDLSRTIVKEK